MFLGMAILYPLIGNALMPLCFLPGFLNQSLFGVRWLSTLPVSRRRLMFSALAPYLLLYTLAILANLNYGIGAHEFGSTALEYRNESVQLGSESPQLVRTERNSHPVITAPWGETYQPGLFDRLGKGWYNPWASGRENSRRFQDWQFRRATLAVYGRELSLDEVALLPELKPLLRQPAVQFLVVALADLFALFVMALMLLPNWYRLNRFPQKVRKGIAIGIAFPAVIGAALLPILAGGPSGSQVTDMLAHLVLRVIPVSSPLLWAGPTGLILCLLWLIDRQFAELEPGLIEAPRRGKWGAASCQSGN